ncbi:hypothetical protein [Massilia sp. TWR1-2-2]|uniref:hypothetical protein n=1 Tax=Massilia sp. TWR1-2-2 TaxID=2804584 RepID=UPI003CFB9E3F
MRPDQVKPGPQCGAALDSDHLVGMGTRDDRRVLLVDIDQMVSGGEMGTDRTNCLPTRQWRVAPLSTPFDHVEREK